MASKKYAKPAQKLHLTALTTLTQSNMHSNDLQLAPTKLNGSNCLNV